MTQFETDVRKCFDNVEGQNKAKTILINSVLAAKNGGELCSPAFYGPKGNGKTHLKGAYARALQLLNFKTKISRPTVFRKVDSADWSEIVNLLSSTGYYLGIDEVHELFDSENKTVQLKKIASFLMRALDGNFKGGTLPLDESDTVIFNRKQCAISIGSNLMGDVPEALRDRFEPVSLELYTEQQLVNILHLMLAQYGLHGNEDSLHIIARCGRGTARPMERIVRSLARLLAAKGEDKKTINKDEIFQALKENEMYPRGLSKMEVMLLNSLKSRMTQRMIKPRFPAFDNQTLNESLGYMLMMGFVDDSAHAGYETSKKGLRYLGDLSDAGFSIPTR